MSSNTPPGSAADPEYVGSTSGAGTANAGGSGKRLGVLAAAAIGVVAVVGLGGWVTYTLLSGAGDQPSEAIPANAIGYLSLDLDPSASQKIEALQILKKFPSIEKELDFGDRDDLRRWVFDAIQDEGACKDLDYAKDVEPWIGDRVAIAAVPGDKDEIAPLLALQVTDQEAATTGIEALAECGEAGNEFGFAFTGDYALMTDSQKKADAFADEAEQASLADDERFQDWTDAAGDPGIVMMYASAEAPGYVMDLQNAPDSYAVEPLVDSGSQAETDRTNDQMKDLYKDFDGMAGVIRFEDGAVEMEVAGKGVPTGFPGPADGADTGVTTLPASTGAALSLALSDGWLEEYLDQTSAMLGGDTSLEDGVGDFEAATGLAVPEDVETLFGDSVSVAVDSDIDFEALSQSEDPSDLLAGIKVHGDPDEIMPVVDKIKANFGPDADVLIAESSDNAVAFGFDQDYVDSLLEEGQLGADETFENVVPDAEAATSVFYIDFDAGDGWADKLADFASEGDPEVTENVKPLDGLGLTTWAEDDVQHGLFRMTTD